MLDSYSKRRRKRFRAPPSSCPPLKSAHNQLPALSVINCLHFATAEHATRASSPVAPSPRKNLQLGYALKLRAPVFYALSVSVMAEQSLRSHPERNNNKDEAVPPLSSTSEHHLYPDPQQQQRRLQEAATTTTTKRSSSSDNVKQQQTLTSSGNIKAIPPPSLPPPPPKTTNVHEAVRAARDDSRAVGVKSRRRDGLRVRRHRAETLSRRHVPNFHLLVEGPAHLRHPAVRRESREGGHRYVPQSTMLRGFEPRG